MNIIMQVIKPLIEKFPKIAWMYRLFRDNKVIIQEPKMTSLGFKFIGNKSMMNSLFEPCETEIVKKIFPKV
jgi:hypothetical protein